MNTWVQRTGAASAFALVLTALTPAHALAQVQLHQLIGSELSSGGQFGMSCDISGDRAIIGASREFWGMNLCGSAYVFDVTTGQQLYRLGPSVPPSAMWFGHDVAIDGDRAVVGACSYPNGLVNFGSAFVFDLTTGLETHWLIPDDSEAGDFFGVSVAIDDDFIVVGTPGDSENGVWSGSAYVYSASTGQKLRLLLPADGGPDDNFGCSVAVSGNRAVIGAFYDDPQGWLSGSAYVFDVSTGQELFKLSALDGAAEDYFGWQVDLDGDYTVIGAYQDDDFGVNSGSAYIFDVRTGLQILKLLPDQGAACENFGFDVSIGGGLALVGTPLNATTDNNAGCAYAFDAFTGEQYGQLLSEDGRPEDRFGWSVNTDGSRVVVGAAGRHFFTGVGYIFAPLPTGMGFCYGDPGFGTPCPCANDNDGSVPGSGCANGAFASGARLTGSGHPRVSDDTLVLTTTGMDPNNSGLYFQANNRIDDGNGQLFGDGLRCVGGSLTRLQVCASSSAGVSRTTIAIGAQGGVSAGDTRRYQCWYRDNSGLQPCGAGVYDFNLSNGYEVVWRP